MSAFENDLAVYDQQLKDFLGILVGTGQWDLYVRAKKFRNVQMAALTGIAGTIDQFCYYTNTRITEIQFSHDSSAVPALIGDVLAFCNSNAPLIEEQRTELDNLRMQFASDDSDIQSQIEDCQRQYAAVEQQYDDAVDADSGMTLVDGTPYSEVDPKVTGLALEMAGIQVQLTNLNFTAQTLDGLGKTIQTMALALRSEYDELSNMSQDIGDGLVLLGDISAFVTELES